MCKYVLGREKFGEKFYVLKSVDDCADKENML